MIINPAMKTPKVKRNRYSIYNSSSLSRQIKTWRLMKIIFFQRRDVSFNGFLDILQRFCAAFTLTDTARKTGTFYYPVVIFTVVNNDLSHNDLPATPHNTSKI